MTLEGASAGGRVGVGGHAADAAAITTFLSGLDATGCQISVGSWGVVDLLVSEALSICDLDLDAIKTQLDPEVTTLSSLTVSSAPDVTAVVNVSGDLSLWSGIGQFGLHPNADASRLVWNFGLTRSLRVPNAIVPGTLIAPSAALTFSNGRINGQVIAFSIQARGVFGHAPFTGTFCTP